MIAHYFIITLFALTGTVTLWACVRDCDWFFTARNTAFLVTRWGRRVARMVYFVIALLLLAFAVIISRTPPQA